MMCKVDILFNCIIELVNSGIPLRDAKVKARKLSIEEIKNLIGDEKYE